MNSVQWMESSVSDSNQMEVNSAVRMESGKLEKPKTVPTFDIINEVETFSKDNKQHQQAQSVHQLRPQHHVEILMKDSTAKCSTRRKDGRKSGDNKSVYRKLFKRIRDILDGNKAKGDEGECNLIFSIW